MDVELLLEHFETHPFLITFLILASMFFLSVWWRGWPSGFSANVDDNEDDTDDFLDEDEETKYSVSWQQTEISISPQGLPDAVKGTMTIKKEED